jgi:hypothetical protein
MSSLTHSQWAVPVESHIMGCGVCLGSSLLAGVKRVVRWDKGIFFAGGRAITVSADYLDVVTAPSSQGGYVNLRWRLVFLGVRAHLCFRI